MLIERSGHLFFEKTSVRKRFRRKNARTSRSAFAAALRMYEKNLWPESLTQGARKDWKRQGTVTLKKRAVPGAEGRYWISALRKN